LFEQNNRGICVEYTQEKNIYGTVCENDRMVLPNRIYVFQIEEARRARKKGGVIKRRDACIRAHLQAMCENNA